LILFLKPYGFQFVFEKTGSSSGGRFAFGRYVRGDRSLELHFRFTLGLVTYQIGDASLDHESYMRALGVYGQNAYPDFLTTRWNRSGLWRGTSRGTVQTF